MSDQQHEWILRLGDDALVLAQRLSEWCSHGPALEEDIALSNIALDLLGQARALLTLAGQREGQGKDQGTRQGEAAGHVGRQDAGQWQRPAA